MIDSKQTEMWEELEQLRRTCADAAARERAADIEKINQATFEDQLGLILGLVVIVILAWLSLTMPDFFLTMQNIMCHPGSSNFGC